MYLTCRLQQPFIFDEASIFQMASRECEWLRFAGGVWCMVVIEFIRMIQTHVGEISNSSNREKSLAHVAVFNSSHPNAAYMCVIELGKNWFR